MSTALSKLRSASVDKETGIVTDEVVYMTADMEDEYIVAQANEPLDENGHFLHAKVNGRYRDELRGSGARPGGLIWTFLRGWLFPWLRP